MSSPLMNIDRPNRFHRTIWHPSPHILRPWRDNDHVLEISVLIFWVNQVVDVVVVVCYPGVSTGYFECSYAAFELH